jgi:serine phosphatase RsbU (regulator of sigma subunit)
VRGVIAGPSDPTGSGLRVAGIQRPLRGAGGDLIWQRRHEGGRRVIVLADVMGHGDLAGRVARLIGSILDGLPYSPPGEAIRSLNEELVRLLPAFHDETMFATGLYLDLDPARSCLRLGNFAHSGLLSSGRGMIHPPGGLPVGILPCDEPWPEMELGFHELGHRFMAYTDGIVEQPDESGSMLGPSGLLREFLEALPVGLKASLERIASRVDAFRGDAPIEDDQSLLAVELADGPRPGTAQRRHSKAPSPAPPHSQGSPTTWH